MTTEPFEIVAAPFTLWWAATGSTFPDLNDTPASPWAKVGTSGDRNYSEDGVVVAHEQTVELFRALGSTGPVKASRTEEGLLIRITLWDMSLGQYRLALNNNTVATTAAGSGTAGIQTLPIYRGLDVTMIALLVRGDVSPEGASWKSQYEIPYVFESGAPEPVFQKGEPMGLELEFTAVEDPNAASASVRFGNLKVQNAAAI
ncbi:hypothetical protein LCGC14_1405350 [marine sediment metagenome]|uniref:Uncharacterized protein n=1 Tax=marine sediment metagenome TaxID=412755 RepID=A0A0F9MB98_9ZZZZ